MATAPDHEGQLPPSLRLLRILVITLLLSMIAGVIAVVWLLVTRLPAVLDQAAAQSAGSTPSLIAAAPGDSGAWSLPATLELPEGATLAAVTVSARWILVVTEDDRVLVFSRDGKLQQELALPAQP